MPWRRERLQNYTTSLLECISLGPRRAPRSEKKTMKGRGVTSRGDGDAISRGHGRARGQGRDGCSLGGGSRVRGGVAWRGRAAGVGTAAVSERRGRGPVASELGAEPGG